MFDYYLEPWDDHGEPEPDLLDCMEQAYNEGTEACAAGVSALRNPYAGRPCMEPLCREWAAGWADECQYLAAAPIPCEEAEHPLFEKADPTGPTRWGPR